MAANQRKARAPSDSVTCPLCGALVRVAALDAHQITPTCKVMRVQVAMKEKDWALTDATVAWCNRVWRAAGVPYEVEPCRVTFSWGRGSPSVEMGVWAPRWACLALGAWYMSMNGRGICQRFRRLNEDSEMQATILSVHMLAAGGAEDTNPLDAVSALLAAYFKEGER